MSTISVSERQQFSLLLVENEVDKEAIRSTLAESGFAVTEARSPEEAVFLVQQRPFDLVFLDMDVSGRDSLTACWEIRAATPRAAIVLAAGAGAEEDRIQALYAGADDCVTKPLQLTELVARLRAVLRRTSHHAVPERTKLQAGDLEIDIERQSLWKAGKEVHLSLKEFEVLAVLMNNEGVPVRTSQLLREAWGPERANQPEHLRVFITRIRKKIEDDPSHPQRILTVPWFGYRFRRRGESAGVARKDDRELPASPSDHHILRLRIPAYNQSELIALGIRELREALCANLISFPSQVPIFQRHDRPDLQQKFVQLYFVLGWSCESIAARYRIAAQRVRNVLKTWQHRAIEMGYIQYIPPAEVLEILRARHLPQFQSREAPSRQTLAMVSSAGAAGPPATHPHLIADE